MKLPRWLKRTEREPTQAAMLKHLYDWSLRVDGRIGDLNNALREATKGGLASAGQCERLEKQLRHGIELLKDRDDKRQAAERQRDMNINAAFSRLEWADVRIEAALKKTHPRTKPKRKSHR